VAASDKLFSQFIHNALRAAIAMRGNRDHERGDLSDAHNYLQ
jgi:hypothetical protein